MKYLIVDAIFSILFVAVLALWVFSFIGLFAASILLFVLLLAVLLYKFDLVAYHEEDMGSEFKEREKRKEERIKRRLLIDKMVAIVDAIIVSTRNLRAYMRGLIYTLE